MPHPGYRRQSNTPVWILVAVFVGIPLLVVCCCAMSPYVVMLVGSMNSNAPQ